MRKLRTLWSRLKGQAAQVREDEAFDAEIREHITLLEQRYRMQGMSGLEKILPASVQRLVVWPTEIIRVSPLVANCLQGRFFHLTSRFR